jgi:predicted small secreted protein
MLHKIAAILALAGLALGLAACNTVEGVGKDVKATGQGIENAAKDVSKKM